LRISADPKLLAGRTIGAPARFATLLAAFVLLPRDFLYLVGTDSQIVSERQRDGIAAKQEQSAYSRQTNFLHFKSPLI